MPTLSPTVLAFSPRDVSSLALTCRRLCRASASDSVWTRLFRKLVVALLKCKGDMLLPVLIRACYYRGRWPWLPLEPGIAGARDAFYTRHAALQQFKFVDPVEMYCSTSTTSTQRTSIILKDDDIIMAQGPNLQISKVDASSVLLTEPKLLRGHNARITCIRSEFGMSRVLGQTMEIKCHDAICYFGSSCSVTAIDIRSMQNIFSVDTYPKRLNCFSLLPSKALICTGFEDKAMLWDIREYNGAKPIADLDEGRVQIVHMDTYKVVTGAYHHGPINIWETDTGTLANSLGCYSLDDSEDFFLSGMAVDGYRIVSTHHNGTLGVAHLRDFANCAIPKYSVESRCSSKFWEPCISSIDG